MGGSRLLGRNPLHQVTVGSPGAPLSYPASPLGVGVSATRDPAMLERWLLLH